MVPPGPDGRQKITTTAMGAAGMVRNIVEETRAGDRSQVTAADDGRQFYQLHPFKRIIVMAAGPVMNLILAVGIFAVLMVGHRRADRRARRLPPSASASFRPPPPAPPSRPTAPPTDAADPGRPGRAAARRHHRRLQRHPGHQLGPAHRPDPGRGRHDRAARLHPRRPAGHQGRRRSCRTSARCSTTTASRSASRPPASSASRVTAPYAAAVDRRGDRPRPATSSARPRKAVVAIPARIPALCGRDLQRRSRGTSNSPVGIVGAGRIGGEILDSDNTSTQDKLVLFLNLVAGFNMSLFLLNMLPLLPLDGGHILGAMIEWVRKRLGQAAGQEGPGTVRRGQADAGRLRRGVVVHRADRC